MLVDKNSESEGLRKKTKGKVWGKHKGGTLGIKINEPESTGTEYYHDEKSKTTKAD